jgi:hypothetical protein
MKKFRKIWMIFVIIVVLAFAGFYGMKMMKEDSSGPVIVGGKDQIEVSIHDGDEVLLAGITASDKKDGDVTSSLIVESISNFYGDDTRTATIVAFDSDHHISKVEREISYTDYTKPRFELTGSLRFRAGEQVNIENIVKATDCLDGDLSNKVKIHMETSINNRMIGFYKVEYEVSNSAGDVVTLPIDVEIYEPYNNEVQLNLTKYLVYYEGKDIDYMSLLKNVRKGNLDYVFGNVQETETPVEEVDTVTETEEPEEVINASQIISKNRVRIDEQVDENTPGVYPVYYYYTEDHGSYTSAAKEVVYVVVQ